MGVKKSVRVSYQMAQCNDTSMNLGVKNVVNTLVTVPPGLNIQNKWICCSLTRALTLGGRVKQIQPFKGFPPIDLGGEFIHGSNTVVNKIAHDNGWVVLPVSYFYLSITPPPYCSCTLKKVLNAINYQISTPVE